MTARLELCLLYHRFFIDNQPAFEFSAEEKQKMSLRTQRFGRQGAEGNRNVNKKLSIDELLKSVVSELGSALEDKGDCCMATIFVFRM